MLSDAGLSGIKKVIILDMKKQSQNASSRIKASIRNYLLLRKKSPRCEVEWFESLSFKEALLNAALAKNWDGKRFSHQYRIKHKSLLAAKRILLKASPAIKKSRNFDELFSMIENTLGNIKGIGELYVYDTALRIAANQGHLPTKVYLHAGTRKGATSLGIDCRGRKYLNVADLPKPFSVLPPYQIEDVLCIYKSFFVSSSLASIESSNCCFVK